MRIPISVDTRQFETTLQGWERQQLPFATSVAINRVGLKVKNAIKGTMQVSFNNPTPYTLNSLMLIPSTKSNLTAVVKFKDSSSNGTPQSSFLSPEVFGGVRAAKPSELLMQAKGVLPSGMGWVPGAGAKLDAYGNMSRSQIFNVMAAIKQMGANVASKPTRSSKKSAKFASTIFVGKPAGGRLPLGVYQQTGEGKLIPLMLFVDMPHYSIRLPFADVSSTVYTTSFQNEFTQALREALILPADSGDSPF